SSSGLSAASASSTRLRASPSPSGSRDVSPIPRKHPSRATTGTRSSSSQRESSPPKRTRAARGWDDNGGNTGKPTNTFAGEFWESPWSSLQELASTVMGNDTTRGG